MTICWINGNLVPLVDARIGPNDRGYLLGDGVFETVALQLGSPAHLPLHLRRLRVGATTLDIDCPWTDCAIAKAVAQLAGSIGYAGSVRITLSRGPAGRGLLAPCSNPTLSIQHAPPAPAPAPITAIFCRCTRRNEASPLARIKSLNYLDSILARQEAARAGADDAILLNTRGHVAEATTANLFARSGGQWRTPPVTDGALPGIMRELLLQRTNAVEARLEPDDLLNADMLLLTNSLGIRTISWLERREYPAEPELLARWLSLLEDCPVSVIGVAEPPV